jgi:hypothetical protein
MTRIKVKADCGNAPKKIFLRDFNIAFAEGNANFIIDHVSNDIHWKIYGDKDVKGKEQFTAEINHMKDYIADEVVIDSIITHGKNAAVNGEMTMGDKVYAFCDIYTFKSASGRIISEMQSYVIKI